MEPFKLGIIENLYAVRFGSVWSGSVNITGPVRFGKFGIYLVRSTTGKNVHEERIAQNAKIHLRKQLFMKAKNFFVKSQRSISEAGEFGLKLELTFFVF